MDSVIRVALIEFFFLCLSAGFQQNSTEFKIKTVARNGWETLDIIVHVNTDERLEEYTALQMRVKTMIDLKRGVSVYKIATNGYDGCYITSTRNTRSLNPTTLKSYLKMWQEDRVFDSADINTSAVFIPSQEKIVNRELLGSRVNELCENLPMYWLMPEKSYSSKEGKYAGVLKETHRHKRSARRLYNQMRPWFNYGKWCGYNNTGIDYAKQCTCDKNTMPFCRKNARPVDQLDEVCLQHDFCSCREDGRDLWRYCKCERDIVDAANRVMCNSLKCVLYRQALIELFRLIPCVCEQPHLVRFSFPCAITRCGLRPCIKWCVIGFIKSSQRLVMNYSWCG